jgi:hypothetical protein
MYVGADNSGASDGGGGTSYLTNPYVLIGASIILYWWLKKREIIKANPHASKSVTALEQTRTIELQATAKENKVPLKLVKDVQGMSKKQVAEMIIRNQKMINNTKMSNDEKKQLLNMVEYLEKELDNKD